MTKNLAKPFDELGKLSPLPRPSKPPTYFTFYSFKGGVGRSMALINCAAILAGRGFRVLAMDLDLEAPGISYFEAEKEKDRQQPGFIDILHDAIHLGEKATFADPDPAKAITHYIREIKVPENLRTFDDGKLFIMPAGKLDGEYEERRQQVNIPRLYESGHGRPLIRLLKKRLDECGLFDFVLIDSRTGFSDEAGICIRDLGEHLVMLLGLNRQNTFGTARFLEQLKKANIKPKSIDIVLSPVPVGEDELFNKRRKEVASLLRKALGKKMPDLDLELPYHPRLALIETPHIFGRRHDFLFQAYRSLEERLRISCGMDPSVLATQARTAIEEGKHDQALSSLGQLIRLDQRLTTSLAWMAISKYRDNIVVQPYFHFLLRLSPSDADVLRIYANYLTDVRKDHDQAEVFYKRAVEAEPGNAIVLRNYAVFLTTVRKDYDRVEEFYRRAVEAEPRDTITLLSYATFLTTVRKDHDQAEDLYERAIEAEPGNAFALRSYASFLTNFRKDHDRAEEFYRRALEVGPKDAFVLGSYADFLTDVRRSHDRAEEFYRQAIEVDPEDAFVLGNYADFLVNVRNDRDRAEEFYRRAVEADPGDAFVLGNYADFLTNVRNDRDRAEEFYRHAVEAAPRNAFVLGNYADFHSEFSKDHGRTEEFYKRAVETDPKNSVVLGNYAIFLADKLKDHDRADELFRRAVKADPGNAMALGNYAVFLRNVRKDHDRAEEFYGRAVEADPGNAFVLGSYADFLTYIRKDYDHAEKLYRRAIDADPGDARMLGGYATFLTDVRKEHDRAEELFLRSIELDSDEADHRVNYSKMLFALGRSDEASEQMHLAWEKSQRDIERLELCFYAYAHRAEPPPDQPLPRMKALLHAGTRSPGWRLAANVERAVADGHPEPEFLAALAAVVADEKPIESLDAFAVWRDTAAYSG